jgi:hypothetical protein
VTFRHAIVEEVLGVLTARCAGPNELLRVLVPICAAALQHVKAEPDDVVQFFHRVTALLDEGEP